MNGAKFNVKCENVHNAYFTSFKILSSVKIKKFYFTADLSI